MAPIPVVQGLSEISEQMSAIREFAAEQQNQVKKFQDGYDWMLIKRFCLRIIRCIDNLEERIRQLQKDHQDVSVLKDVRDEILFALESSGVEQYEPEIGLDYRGLERYAESVREKVENSDPEKSGHIAEVVRPGYQYLLNDEEVKIVRCAQVKLYA
jgi:molecular chaperone GrpE (heat shock protein)